MASQEQLLSPSSSAPALQTQDSLISELCEKHQRELENLTFTKQPLNSLKFFILAVMQYIQQQILHVFSKCACLILLSVLAGGIGILATTGARSHEEVLLHYLRFGLWWLVLGVASSIGMGCGLHTFVLYLGPHIALFTLKSVHCGRVDIKSAPYDTIQLKSSPSWLDRDCSDYGPPLYSPLGSRVPLSRILPQVQLEAILWGVGTALGELPPYFISRAAGISGEELDSSSQEESGFIANLLKPIKQWLVLHSQHCSFLIILVLASVPNPLFDLAGIMCGQLGIPFWKFFSATLIGKAIIKTHIQTAFIISVCNNQLLDLIENELIWVLGLIPGLASILPNLITKLHVVKKKYMTASPPVSSNIKVKKWELSFASIWNSIVWLVLLNFFIKMVTATARSYLKKQQEMELATLANSASS